MFTYIRYVVLIHVFLTRLWVQMHKKQYVPIDYGRAEASLIRYAHFAIPTKPI